MRDVPDLGAIPFRRHRDAGAALNATFGFLRANARELATSYVALIVPMLLASVLSSMLWLNQLGDVFSDPESFVDSPLLFGGAYFGSLAFGLVGGALMQAAASGYVRLYREGAAGSIAIADLWEASRGLILPYLGMTLVFFVVALASAIVNIIPCLGSLAWLAFIVWLMPQYAVAVAARALEAESVAEAWARARVLVKGSWGFAFGTLLLAFCVLLLLYVGMSIVLGAVFSLVGTSSTDPAAAITGLGFVMAPIQVLIGVAYLVPLVAAFFVHGRLVEEVEGTTLGEDLDTLAAGFDTPSAFASPASTPPAPSPDTPPAGPDDEPPPSGGFRGGGFE